MNCIKCGSSQVHVIDTRAKGPRRIYRRRDCLACGYRWTTVELPAGDLRRPLRQLEAEHLNRGLRIVKELELDKKYGWSSPALKAA